MFNTLISYYYVACLTDFKKAMCVTHFYVTHILIINIYFKIT